MTLCGDLDSVCLVIGHQVGEFVVCGIFYDVFKVGVQLEVHGRMVVQCGLIKRVPG